eukprot:2415459-Pleurochrysis_carterae.AAC.1
MCGGQVDAWTPCSDRNSVNSLGKNSRTRRRRRRRRRECRSTIFRARRWHCRGGSLSRGRVALSGRTHTEWKAHVVEAGLDCAFSERRRQA